MIETVGLTKTFGEKTAVRDLNLEIPAGELFALIGPNGAGKTTTLKLLSGLLIPTSGRALIGGRDIHREGPEAKRLVGYIPDFPYLYERLTVREFMEFIAGIYALDPAGTGGEIRRYLELLGLDDRAGELTRNLSHGYRQRLVFAATLLHRPRALIIDEPMVGLDPRTGRLIKDLLRKHCRDGGAILLSTHTLSVAEEIADRVGVIDRGRLVAAGSLEELRRRSGTAGRLEEVFFRLTEEEQGGPAGQT